MTHSLSKARWRQKPYLSHSPLCIWHLASVTKIISEKMNQRGYINFLFYVQNFFLTPYNGVSKSSWKMYSAGKLCMDLIFFFYQKKKLLIPLCHKLLELPSGIYSLTPDKSVWFFLIERVRLNRTWRTEGNTKETVVYRSRSQNVVYVLYTT